MNNSKYFIKAFVWSFIAKISDSVIKLISIPLLLNYFGRNNFGLLNLVLAANAYLIILDLGINTGAIRFFSQWIEKNEYNLIDRVSRTSMSFYALVGLVNSFALLFLALYGTQIFNVSEEQRDDLSRLFLILAVFSIANWGTSVFNQLLIADEKIPFIQIINIFKSIANITLVIITVNTKISLTNYFLATTAVNSLTVIPYYFKSKKLGFVTSFKPAFYLKDFKPILTYSISIFLLAIFQLTATNSRPIILGIFSNEGVGVVSDYRIMETITSLVITLGGILISIYLPKASKLVLANNQEELKKFAISSTSLTSIIVIILCFPLVINSKAIISLYVGKEFEYLSWWLIIWLLSILLFLHNSPISSLVLATGKIKYLVYSSAIACIISLVVNIYLCPLIGVGSVVIGYLIYIIIQMSFYYFYFTSKVLLIDSIQVFKGFLFPLIIAIISLIPILFLSFDRTTVLIEICLKSIIWATLFVLQLFIWKLITWRSIKHFIKLQV